MGRTILLAAVATALVAAPSAFAKGPIQVCGASGCGVLGPETDMGLWLGNAPGTQLAKPPTPAPYFVLRFSDVAGTLGYWIPSGSVLRTFTGSPEWLTTAPDREAALLQATAGLQPYPAPTNAVVLVDYKDAKRGGTYLRLFTIGTPVAPPRASTGWLAIWLKGGTSPWTDGLSSLWISKKGSLLKRDGQFLKISPTLAKRIRARLPLG